MRHQNIHRKFGREAQHRMAMLRNQVTSVLEHERITTTDMKAKEVRKMVEKVITLGKRGDVHARRLAFKTVRNREVIQKLFGEIAERFRTRPGGYTRILKIGNRVGDAAPMSILELLKADGASEGQADKPAKEAKPKKDAGEAKAKKAAKSADKSEEKASKKKTKK
ncbi:MAG: 50S ribosomal protein L17 [Deltaproteobacteria bacterium]|nr:50S ribosomal protein L17 [Deltaproteobacteria bacterium]